MAVPNIEGITALLFISGWVLGIKRGVVAAIIAVLLYSGFNPQGTFPPTLVAQIIGMATAPIAGGLLRKNELNKPMDRLILALTALVLTLWFDLLTNLAFPLTAGLGMRGIVTTLILGIPYSLVHVGSNIAIFVMVVPLLINFVRRYRLT
ncbi:MAG: hypothetical protein P9M15_06800 [Candidatus Electryoneaceae bacterium]|nr:hypothetical protein [Candidatus Electryoneaceae bacterium]